MSRKFFPSRCAIASFAFTLIFASMSQAQSYACQIKTKGDARFWVGAQLVIKVVSSKRTASITGEKISQTGQAAVLGDILEDSPKRFSVKWTIEGLVPERRAMLRWVSEVDVPTRLSFNKSTGRAVVSGDVIPYFGGNANWQTNGTCGLVDPS